jgi:hypothetical protein
MRPRFGFLFGLGLLSLPGGVARADTPQSHPVVVVDVAPDAGVGWIFVGLGTAGMIGGGYWWSQTKSQSDVAGPVLVSLGGLAFVGLGTIGLLAPTRFEQLSDYYEADRATGRPPSFVRKDVERLWTRYADTEHAQRRTVALAFITFGALELTAGVVGWLAGSSIPFLSGSGVPNVASGLVLGGDGALLLLWEPQGPIESRLHEYQSTASRTVTFHGEF